MRKKPKKPKRKLKTQEKNSKLKEKTQCLGGLVLSQVMLKKKPAIVPK